MALHLALQEPKLFRGMVMLAPAIMPGTNLVPAWKVNSHPMMTSVLSSSNSRGHCS